jgi:maleate isomerase
MQSRLGMLTPSSNTVLEPVTMRLMASLSDQLSAHFSRFRVLLIADTPQSHAQFAFAPILDSVVVTFWAALRHLGIRTPISGFGMLLGRQYLEQENINI